MAEFDVVIRGGIVVDGTRLPRYQSDVGVKDGKIAKIGNLKAHQGKKVIDATARLSRLASSTCTRITMRSFSGTRTAQSRAGMASLQS